MSYSIIIPSRNIDNLTACVKALREAGETSRVIVVDDRLGGAPGGFAWWESIKPYRVVNGDKPFCFARNVNIGIRESGDDDVVILNDDALLEYGAAPGFALMRAQTQDHPDIGILGATTNVTGYPAQHRRKLRDSDVMAREVQTLAFVCVYIPRRTLNTVGLLDERFTTYGGEDVDYCIRVREAGLKCGVTDWVYVDHSKLPSTFRAAHSENDAPGDIKEGVRLLREKWGDKCPRFPC